jgi:hypothetical protein
VFIDTTRFNNFIVSPINNGLSDHEGQVLTIVLPFTLIREHQTYTFRKINTFTVADFLNQLSYEYWEDIFGGGNVNHIFNTFLNSYLRIFNSCFPMVHKQNITKVRTLTGLPLALESPANEKKKIIFKAKKRREFSSKSLLF